MPLSGIFGIGGTGFVGAYNASQYTPSQLAEYVLEQVQEQAYNKTVAMCPKAGRLQNVMPVSVNSYNPKNDRPFCRCHLFFKLSIANPELRPVAL